MALEIGNGAKVRRHRRDAPRLVPLDDIARHIPALNRIGKVGAERDHGSRLERRVPGLGGIVAPHFHQHVDIALAEPGDERQRGPRQHVRLAAIAAFEDDARKFGMKGVGIPVEPAKHDRAVDFASGLGGLPGPGRAGQTDKGREREKKPDQHVRTIRTGRSLDHRP